MKSIGLMLLVQVILIALNAVFACAEIAVISMNDTKLAKRAAEGDKRAVRLQKLTREPARFLSVIQIAITLSGFLGASFAAENFSDPLVNWLIGIGVGIPRTVLSYMAVVVITLILSYFTLIFGELVPKRVAMRNSERVSLAISGLVCAISTVFKPIVWLLTVSTNAVLRLLHIDPNADDEEGSEEEILMMVDAGSEKGFIDPEDKQLIQNVFEFDDLTAGEIATHRTDICVLWMDETLEQWDDIIRNNRHTRYPVCDDSIDNVVGVLNAKDYYRLTERTMQTVLDSCVKPAYFVPESVKTDVLFKNMKRTRNNLAIVLDEYGGVSGIVTFSDLIEQLVGDLVEDEQAPAEEPIQVLDENLWKIHGSVPLEDVAEALGLELGEDEADYDTFNGLIFDALGAIPRDGSTVELQSHGMNIRVTDIRDHQVECALVSLLPKSEPAAEDKKD